MSFEAPAAGRTASTSLIELEERYAHERYQLYEAKAYGSRLRVQGACASSSEGQHWRRAGWIGHEPLATTTRQIVP
jgi:hypothetical protein